MPGWAKALIITGVVLVLLVVGVIGAGVFWWVRNKDAIVARGKAQMDEGTHYGRSSDNQGCVDEAISRYKNEPGFSAVLATNLFMSSCLRSSRPTAGFCDEIPKQTDFVKSGQWRVDQCNRVNLSSDTYCSELFAPVQQFCERPASNPENTNSSDR